MEPSPRPLCRVDHPHSSGRVFCRLLSAYSPAVHAAFIAVVACGGEVSLSTMALRSFQRRDSGSV